MGAALREQLHIRTRQDVIVHVNQSHGSSPVWFPLVMVFHRSHAELYDKGCSPFPQRSKNGTASASRLRRETFWRRQARSVEISALKTEGSRRIPLRKALANPFDEQPIRLALEGVGGESAERAALAGIRPFSLTAKRSLGVGGK